jgi:aminoglycoside phosphotransferase (APT) family kinase protein
MHDRLLLYYQHRYPQARLTDVVRMTDGLASDVFGFILDTGDGPQELIFKSYPGGEDAPGKATSEYTTMRRLAEIGYPVPHVHLCETDSAACGKPFIIMDRIRGRVLWDVITSAPEAEARRLTERFCQLFVDLHALDWRALEPYDGEACIQREIQALRTMAEQSGHPEFVRVVNWLDRQPIICDRPSLIHRDYHPWNVLLTDDDRLWVIDWNSEISDARFDLAWTVALMYRAGFVDFSRDVLSIYQQIAGEVADQPYFDVAANLRWMMIVLHSIQTGAALRTDALDNFRLMLMPMIQKACVLVSDITSIPLKIDL